MRSAGWICLLLLSLMTACDGEPDVVDPGRADADGTGGRLDGGVDAARDAATRDAVVDATPRDQGPPGCQPGTCGEGRVCGDDGRCDAAARDVRGRALRRRRSLRPGPLPDDVACAAGAFCSAAGQCVDGCRTSADDCAAGFRSPDP
ncbi:MAG: hypothetical protein R3F60_24190 [bacterium]